MQGQGTIYFIQEEPTGPIKIGWTRGNVRDRWHNVQTGNSRIVTLIAVINGATKAEEFAWHRRFDSCAARGEWFWPTKELLEAIGAEATKVSVDRPKSKQRRRNLPAWVYAVQAWVDAQDMTMWALAEKLGCSSTTAASLYYGNVPVSLPIAKRLELISGGKLKAAELLKSSTLNPRVRAFIKRNSSDGAA